MHFAREAPISLSAISGNCSRRNEPVPVSVPPVPTQATNAWIGPATWANISDGYFKTPSIGAIDVADTDPQVTGRPPLDPVAHNEASEKTAEVAIEFLRQARELLADQPQALITADDAMAMVDLADPADPAVGSWRTAAGERIGTLVCARDKLPADAVQAIHDASPRHEKPFVALNCAAIPRDLMESEIFGHVKGAFTGAVTAREGAAARADGGTLFLDEIGDMSPALQARLLRALAEAHPLLLILDDLQWVDQTSAGLLFHLGRRLEGARILIVGTYRPVEVALGREIDLEQDLKSAGAANMVSGLTGGLPGYHLLGETMLTSRMGVTGPAAAARAGRGRGDGTADGCQVRPPFATLVSSCPGRAAPAGTDGTGRPGFSGGALLLRAAG